MQCNLKSLQISHDAICPFNNTSVPLRRHPLVRKKKDVRNGRIPEIAALLTPRLRSMTPRTLKITSVVLDRRTIIRTKRERGDIDSSTTTHHTVKYTVK